MSGVAHVYLIPGFFGFADVGGFKYFAHVRDALARSLDAEGVRAEVHEVHTRPTASLAARTARLLDTIDATAGDGGPLHLIGHSTGGLDARLLLLPGVRLPTSVSPEPYAARVRSVITLATPHRGAPLASVLNTLQGQQVLRLLSLTALYVIRKDRLPDGVRARVASLLPGGLAPAGLGEQIYHDLLADFRPERREQVEALLADAASDTTLLVQLRPEGVDLLNAAPSPRPGVACASVITAAPPPGEGDRAGERRLGHAASRSLYTRLYPLSMPMPERFRPPLTPAQQAALAAGGPRFLARGASDGMVPVHSQVWGEVLATVVADHLDVIGHFDGPELTPPHRDWLFSGANFRRSDFEALCLRMARYIAAS